MYLRKALLNEILHQSHFRCFQTSFLQSLGTEKQLSSCYRSILPDLTAQLKDGEKTPLNLYPSVCLQRRTVDTGNSHTGACRTTTERLAFHSRLQFINDWEQNGFNILARLPSSFLLFHVTQQHQLQLFHNLSIPRFQNAYSHCIFPFLQMQQKWCA